MSLDHVVYARTKRRSMRAIRAAASSALTRHEGWTLQPIDDERDEDELWISGLGGPIAVETYGFGISLSVSSTTGAREQFVELGELANEIAAELGTVLDETEAAQLIDAEQPPAGTPSSAPVATLANRVVILLHGDDDEELHRVTCSHQQFAVQQVGDRLRDELVDANIPAILSEEGRLSLRGRRLTCTVYGRSGAPTVCYRYRLDGYGRIVSVSVERS